VRKNFGRVTVGKGLWEGFETGWVYIGAGKIVSRLGYTVTRFLC